MAKVLLALFVGLFRRRPVPSDQPPDRPEGEAVAPAAGTPPAGERAPEATVGR
jgi:hypothetical protein